MVWDYRKVLDKGRVPTVRFVKFCHVGLNITNPQRFSHVFAGHLARGIKQFTSVGQAIYHFIVELSRPVNFSSGFPAPWSTLRLPQLIGNTISHSTPKATDRPTFFLLEKDDRNDMANDSDGDSLGDIWDNLDDEGDDLEDDGHDSARRLELD